MSQSKPERVSYDAYVPSLIAEDDFLLSSRVAAAAADAELACRELNEEPPRPAILETLARQLLHAEAMASSRIEGLVLSHQRLAEVASSETIGDVNAQSVLANIAVVERAVALASEVDELGGDHLLELDRILLAGTPDEELGGVLRAEQSWIGSAAPGPRSARFVLRPHELVSALLDDLCAFCNRKDIPAAIQAAIAHAQFEAISPFHVGNARVGRALTLIILGRRLTTPRCLPPVSLALAGRADRYVAGVASWQNGDENDWYMTFCDALYRAATGARRFAGRVADLQHAWIDGAGNPRRGSGALRLIELLPAQPILNVKGAARLLGGTDEQARQAILRLEQAGVLRQSAVRRRNRTWECVGLFDLLDRLELELGPDGATSTRGRRESQAAGGRSRVSSAAPSRRVRTGDRRARPATT